MSLPTIDEDSETINAHSRNKKLVETLFIQSETLIMGWASQSACCGIAYWETGDLPYLYFIPILTLILAVRLLDAAWFHRTFAPRSPEEVSSGDIAHWEVRYMIGSGSTATGLALISAYTLYWYPVSLAAVGAVSLSIGTMISVVGKNFSSKKNVHLLVGITCSAMFFAMVARAVMDFNLKLFFLALLLAPLSAVTIQMANRVRKLLDDRMNSENQSTLAERVVQAALRYMPNGLLMINEAQCIKIMNDKAAGMLGISDRDTVVKNKVPLKRMVAMAVRDGKFSRHEARTILHHMNSLLSGSATDHTFKMGDCYIKLSINRLPMLNRLGKTVDGGAVLICEDVTAKVEADAKVQYLANYDALSNLPVRRYMNENIVKAVENMADDEIIAISIFDVDKFKLINDIQGHAMGDEAIRRVGRALNSITLPNYLNGRYAGDEFVVAVYGLKDDSEVKSMFDKIFGEVCQSHEIIDDIVDQNGNQIKTVRTLNIRCSGGVIMRGKHDFDLDDAINKADLALLEAKKDPDVRWRMFDQTMADKHEKAEKFSEDFRNALRNGELRAVYQPMYTADGSHISACEALCRWTHPVLGEIAPSIFVPLAEADNLIKELTKQVLLRACRDCAQWPDANVGVSVNLSAIDLNNTDIIDVIECILNETALDPKRLQIEVTESVFLKDKEKAALILHKLRAMGVKTAIDDFGTGYSNLSYLNELPLDKLKIDRSFLKKVETDNNASHFFNSLVSFSKALGFEIVVEGVETEGQLDIIRGTQADMIQGFFFGRPMEHSQIVDLVREQSKRPPRVETTSNVIPLRRQNMAK